MKKLYHILFLCGLYFLASSFFTLILPLYRTIFAVLFPIFLLLILIVVLKKPITSLQDFKQKYPKIFNLLAIIGGYLLIYFFLHIPLAFNNQIINIPNIENIIAIIDFLLFAISLILFIITLFKKNKR